MNRPRVLIVEPSEFNRRLMSDLVECNDMKATAVPQFEGNAVAQAEIDRANIIVVDLDSAKPDVAKVVKRLRSSSHPPRVVGIAAGIPEKRMKFDVEEVVCRPIDVGDFARAISRQALEARRTGLE